MISGIIKVEVSFISRCRRLRLITLTETLIIPDTTKTESNNCFIIHCFEENNDKRIIAAIRVYFQTHCSWKSCIARAMHECGEKRRITEITPAELDSPLCNVDITAKKKDNTAYEPDTMLSFSRSIQRYSEDSKATFNWYPQRRGIQGLKRSP